MKARRRHELHENLLAAELKKAAASFRKYGTYVAWGVLIVALTVLVVVYSRSKSRQRTTQIQSRYDRLVSSQFSPQANLDQLLSGFKGLIEQDADPRIAANACAYTGALYARQAAAGPGSSPAVLLESPREEARRYYERTIEEFPDQSEAVARARLGLAKLAEGQGEFDEAKKQYRMIVQMDEMRGRPIRYEASAALDRLDALSTPVRMASTAPSTEAPTATARVVAGETMPAEP